MLVRHHHLNVKRVLSNGRKHFLHMRHGKMMVRHRAGLHGHHHWLNVGQGPTNAIEGYGFLSGLLGSVGLGIKETRPVAFQRIVTPITASMPVFGLGHPKKLGNIRAGILKSLKRR